MDTKGIDLKKCKGWYFKASIDGLTCEGRIQVENGIVYLCQNKKDGCDCKDKFGFKYSWTVGGGLEDDLRGTKVSDFEIIPRDPETYRDWQVGDRATDPNKKWSDSYKEIIFRSGELVLCKDGNGDISGGYTCGQLHRLGYRLVLTDIEKQVIEESKKSEWEPQDGDIVAWKDKEDNGPDAVSIYKGKDRGYATMFTNGDIIYSPYTPLAMNIIRPATEEEKQKLFDAMKKNGKRWNAEKKVVEDIPKPYEFRKGDPVLVRNFVNEPWELSAFIEKDDKKVKTGFPFGAGPNHRFDICLPYNEKTMHLLGTTEDYKEE